MSRLNLATEAVRPALKARCSFSGPQGSGKTLTMLEVASILAPGGRHLLIDTEKESALTYADVYTFKHLPWLPPFDPRELGATLREAGHQYDTIIVDSLSHFWFGEGGTLQIADGKFGGWKVARPAQEDLVAGILGADAHVLLGVRAKVEFAQELEGNRVVVKKLGMADRQDDQLGYELNVTVDMNMEHQMTISKSRTVAVPVGRTFQPGHATDFAHLYGDWLAGGEPPLSADEMDALKGELGQLDQYQSEWARGEWNRRAIPPLMVLRSSQLHQAHALIADAKAYSPDRTPEAAPAAAADAA